MWIRALNLYPNCPEDAFLSIEELTPDNQVISSWMILGTFGCNELEVPWDIIIAHID